MDVLRSLRRWLLGATLVVSAAIPWYTLRTLPVFAVASAKINILDVLVGCAVLVTLSNIIRGIRDRDQLVLSVCIFLIGMIIPLLKGLIDPDGAFFAIREARALAFYAIALAFATAGFDANEFRVFGGVYAIAAAIAAGAVFLHVYWGVPLPGYENVVLYPWNGSTSVVQVAYLQWTTPVIAILLSFYGVLSSSQRVVRIVWTANLALLAWYVLAAAERFVQVLTVVAIAVLIAQTAWAGRTFRPKVVLGTILAVVVALGLATITDAKIGAWTRYAALRWSKALSDGSIEYRIQEIVAGLPVETSDPLFGNGLGTSIRLPDPAAWWAAQHSEVGPGMVLRWQYVSTGYGFLLIRTGAVGLILYLAMFGAAFQAVRRGLQAGVDPNSWSGAVVGSAGLVILLIANVLHPVVDIAESVIAFGLFCGMVASGREPNRRLEPS